MAKRTAVKKEPEVKTRRVRKIPREKSRPAEKEQPAKHVPFEEYVHRGGKLNQYFDPNHLRELGDALKSHAERLVSIAIYMEDKGVPFVDVAAQRIHEVTFRVLKKWIAGVQTEAENQFYLRGGVAGPDNFRKK